MEGRIRLMSAITPTYAHAYQSLCLAGRVFVVGHQRFRLPAAKAIYPNLHNSRTTTREKGNDFQGLAIHTDGGTRVSDGETTAGWGAVARSPDGKLKIMFGPVITTETHISHMQVPECTPTTPLKSRVLL